MAWVATGRGEGQGLAAVEAIGPGVLFHQTNVTQRDQLEGLMTATVERFGRLDALINCAIRVNAMSPGAVDTPMTVVTSRDECIAAVFCAAIPVGRFAQPGEIAAPSRGSRPACDRRHSRAWWA